MPFPVVACKCVGRTPNTRARDALRHAKAETTFRFDARPPNRPPIDSNGYLDGANHLRIRIYAVRIGSQCCLGMIEAVEESSGFTGPARTGMQHRFSASDATDCECG